MKRYIVQVLVITIVLTGLPYSLPAQATVGDTVGTATFAALSAPAWRITAVEGDGVFLQGGANTLVLEVGGRYVFDLTGVDSESFPMELRDGSGTVLASQREAVEVEGLEAANISVSDDAIEFTLTEELAARLSFYRAATYPSMLGVIQTYTPQAEDSEDSTSEED